MGWHVEQGYLWSYVLLTHLLAPLVVGLTLRPWRRAAQKPLGARGV
ncbi:hypothetical protein [Terrabacter sp. C0L_2]|nr:hypothetical protein U5C87_21910 [Terrabacter sp. C0L_2]